MTLRDEVDMRSTKPAPIKESTKKYNFNQKTPVAPVKQQPAVQPRNHERDLGRPSLVSHRDLPDPSVQYEYFVYRIVDGLEDTSWRRQGPYRSKVAAWKYANNQAKIDVGAGYGVAAVQVTGPGIGMGGGDGH